MDVGSCQVWPLTNAAREFPMRPEYWVCLSDPEAEPPSGMLVFGSRSMGLRRLEVVTVGITQWHVIAEWDPAYTFALHVFAE